MPWKEPSLLHVVGLNELTGERERALDHHVVSGDEVDLRLDVGRIGQQRIVRVDEVAVE